MNATVFLLLGTNMGDRNKNLAETLTAIAKGIGKIRKKSSVYETAAWGKTDQEPFYNQVIELETLLNPQQVLGELLAIEQKMGRKRMDPWGERIIDADILFYGDEIIKTNDLIVPHPQLTYRRFTLVPLNEIAPDLVHPIFQKKISELLNECPDKLSVEKI
jgi:2-amino-4-hydroxy-6-hydroxymethyldihydropteridine diphosphokinase